MTFLAPLFLAALVAVALPVIIHLINFRKPRRVSFSTLSFFRELQQSTIRRLKFKRWLLLAIRAGIVIALALALARPFAAGTGFTGSAPVLYGILLENGIGMTRIDAEGPMIDQARDIASGIIDNARDHDRFLIYNTHGQLVRGGLLTAGQARNTLQEIESGAYGSQLNDRFRALTTAMDEWGGGARVMYWLGSGTLGSVQTLSGTEQIDRASDVPINKIVLGSDRSSNTVVQSIQPVSAVSGVGIPFGVEVTVENTGNEAVFNHFVSLEVGDRMIGQYQADLEAGAARSFVFDIIPEQSGDLTGRVLLEGDAFSADNTHFFSINIPESRRVLLVLDGGSGSSYVQSVLRAGERIRAQLQIETITLDELAGRTDLTGYHAIVLDEPVQIPDGLQELLQRFVQAGNGLVFYPSERGSVASYNRFLSRFNAGEIVGFSGEYASFNAVTRLGEITRGHPVLDRVFEVRDDEAIRVTLPSIYYYLRYRSGGTGSGLTVLRSELGDPLLIEQSFGNGKVMINLMGASPGWSALPGSALFAPLAYRTTLYAASVTAAEMLAHTLGNTLNVELPMQGPIVDIHRGESGYRAESRVTGSGLLRISFPGVEWEPGIYTVSDGSAERKLAVNLDISESDFRSLSNQELENVLNERVNLSRVFQTGDQGLDQLRTEIETAGFGSELWNWFILLAFVLLLAETIVARWYKAETIT